MTTLPQLPVFVVEDLGSLHACRDQWTLLRELNDRSPRPNPYLTPEYMAAYLEHNELYRPGQVRSRILVCRAENGGDIMAALPLKEVRARALGLPFTRLEFLVATEIDRPRVLAAAEHEDAAARALLRHMTRHMHRHAMIQLINLEPHSGLWRARDAGRRPWTRVKVFAGMPMNEVRRAHDDLPGFFKAMDRSVSQGIARRGRRLFESGTISVLSSCDPRVLRDLLAVYLDVEARSWKVEAKVGIARHPQRQALFEALAEPGQPMSLHVWLLLHDGVPAAALLNGCFGPNCFGLENCYDDYYRALSPGNILALLETEDFLHSGVETLALHGHFGYHKQRWLADTFDTHNLCIYRRASPPALRTRLGEVRRALRPRDDAAGISASDHNPKRRQAVGVPDEPSTPSFGGGQPPLRRPTEATMAALARARAVPGAVTVFEGEALKQRLPFTFK
ncbi:MAG: GNAT family N-acetyltransferase [Pseudomonadota bacterium]